jgi:hypothetical protein
MAEVFSVTATTLNVRGSPLINPANIVGRLGQGELVEKVGQPSTDWLQIRAPNVSGFASARFLSRVEAPLPPPPAPAAFIPPQVHFPAGSRSRLDSTNDRHSPLKGFQPQPRPAGQSDAERCTALHSIIQSLDVEHSERYVRTGSTFCNIYAYDVSYLAGVYLPRVWWMAKALLEISRGGNPGVVYAKTVRELNANALFDWLSEWGDEFGWQRCANLNALQDAANRGAVGVICAQRKDLSRSGHITVVVPESAGRTAERTGQTVTRPLQSQAGARNKQYFANQWWVDLDIQFRAHGFWACA